MKKNKNLSIKELLKSKYGQMESDVLSPYERVKISLEHEEPDRVPFDFWAVPIIIKKLKTKLNVKNKQELLDLLGIDIRIVKPDYVGPAPKQLKDGSYIDEWGTHRRKVKNRTGGVYEEYVDYPLAEMKTVKEIENWEGWPKSEHWEVSNLRSKIKQINDKTKFFIRYNAGGIFETAWGLYGFENFLIDMIEKPEIPCAIMDQITEILIANVTKVLNKAGDLIDMVSTYDDVGIQNNLLISKDLWKKYILPRHQKLNNAIRQHKVKIMYHSCGAIYPLIEDFIEEMGIDILNPLQPKAKGMDMKKVKNKFGSKISFHGAVDIQDTLPNGTVSEVENEIRNRCEVLGENGGYICASAHHIQSDTSIENIIAMYTIDREI